jgi:Protein of unknown function (DUF2742)
VCQLKHNSSQQADWFSVYLFVEPLLARRRSWPAAGTTEWAALADDDPRKMAAVLDAGVHWALRIDATQVALAQAQLDVSEAADWTSLANSIYRGRGSAYIPRRIAS